jgi:hypothetical protein
MKTTIFGLDAADVLLALDLTNFIVLQAVRRLVAEGREGLATYVRKEEPMTDVLGRQAVVIEAAMKEAGIDPVQFLSLLKDDPASDVTGQDIRDAIAQLEKLEK